MFWGVVEFIGSVLAWFIEGFSITEPRKKKGE